MKLTLDQVKKRLKHIESMEAAGVKKEIFDLGPPAFLRRKFRNGKETLEILPRQLAEWTLLAIPEREPNVARASLRTNDYH